MILLFVYVLLFTSIAFCMEQQKDMHMPLSKVQDTVQEFDLVAFDRNLQELISAGSALECGRVWESPPYSSHESVPGSEEEEEAPFVGRPQLSLFDAVVQLNDQCIKHCLHEGASLQVKDEQGKTLLHHLAKRDIYALQTVSALMFAPRKNVVDTILKLRLRHNAIYPRMVNWHIAGLVRVLLMQDKQGNIPLDYAKVDRDAQWQCYFQVNHGYWQKYFSTDIMLGYINLCAGEK